MFTDSEFKPQNTRLLCSLDMQVRHTKTHVHEAVTRKTTWKEMGTNKEDHQVCETKYSLNYFIYQL